MAHSISTRRSRIGLIFEATGSSRTQRRLFAPPPWVASRPPRLTQEAFRSPNSNPGSHRRSWLPSLRVSSTSTWSTTPLMQRGLRTLTSPARLPSASDPLQSPCNASAGSTSSRESAVDAVIDLLVIDRLPEVVRAGARERSQHSSTSTSNLPPVLLVGEDPVISVKDGVRTDNISELARAWTRYESASCWIKKI